MTRPEDNASLRSYLQPGERLLWAGRPARGLHFTPQDLYLVPFSLLWGGFVIFWNVDAWTAEAPSFFQLWGLPFLAVGLYLIAGRFVHGAWLRAHTLYGVSDRRVLFLLTGPFGRFRSLELTNLPLFEFEEHRGGRGTIVFDDAGSGHWSDHFTSQGQWGRWMPELAGPRFVRIEQPRPVYELISRESDRRRAETARGGGL